MYNEFGKYVRKLRIDKGEILKTMADKLDVSTAYLSSMETGKKEIPMNMYDKITDIYCLDEEQQRELKKVISLSKKAFDIELDQTSKAKQQLAFSFARDLDKISEEAAKQLLARLEEEINKQKWTIYL